VDGSLGRRRTGGSVSSSPNRIGPPGDAVLQHGGPYPALHCPQSLRATPPSRKSEAAP
jgi:hypothetical protein